MFSCLKYYYYPFSFWTKKKSGKKSCINNKYIIEYWHHLDWERLKIYTKNIWNDNCLTKFPFIFSNLSFLVIKVRWLPIHHRQDFHLLKLVYKALHYEGWPSNRRLEEHKPTRSDPQQETAKSFPNISLNVRELTIYTNTFHKHKTFLKFDVVGERPSTKYIQGWTDQKKKRKLASLQFTAQISFWSFPNGMTQTIWFPVFPCKLQVAVNNTCSH